MLTDLDSLGIFPRNFGFSVKPRGSFTHANCEMEERRRRLTLYDQMLAVDNSNSREPAGLTLDYLLSCDKRAAAQALAPAAQLANRTLLEIIRDDEPKELIGQKEKNTWQSIRHRLRLKRTGQIPNPPNPSESTQSHVSSQNTNGAIRSFNSRRFTTANDNNSENQNEQARGEGTRRLSVALAEERALSAREAVAAQEVTADAEEGVEPSQDTAAPRMSLMNLLEETDSQIGLDGSRRYGSRDDEEEGEERESGGGEEYKCCCVCMVRNKGAALIPCGHTFCRLCSREVWVSRGNCPLCNGFILEILHIF